MHFFWEKRKLSDSLVHFRNIHNVWHVEDSACFLPSATGWEVLLWTAQSFPALAEKHQIFLFYYFLVRVVFFFGHSWENFTLFKEDISRVGRKASCLWSLPPHWCKASRYNTCLSTWPVGKHPAQECGWVRGHWLLTNHSYHCPMSWGSQGGTACRHCLCAISQCLVQGTRHTTGSSPTCKQNRVTTSALYLSALDLNLDVEDVLYLITIFLIHLNDVEFFEISCER